jgi:hypothetical protein
MRLVLKWLFKPCFEVVNWQGRKVKGACCLMYNRRAAIVKIMQSLILEPISCVLFFEVNFKTGW